MDDLLLDQRPVSFGRCALTITLYLDTDADHFIYWLSHHVTQWQDDPQTHRHGRLVCQRAPVLEKGRLLHKPWGRNGAAYAPESSDIEIAGRLLVRILGYWQEMGGKGARGACDFEFAIEPLSPSDHPRIKVTIERPGYPDLDYLHLLLDDVARDYLETASTIAEYKKPYAPPQPPLLQVGGEQDEKESARGTPAVQLLESLRQNIAEHFNLDELRTLCFDMGIKHENLAASTLDGMARELVDYCKRTGRIRELVVKGRKLRPNVSWKDVPE
jgi:hypothetical protein